jgi:hypothetical protein
MSQEKDSASGNGVWFAVTVFVLGSSMALGIGRAGKGAGGDVDVRAVTAPSGPALSSVSSQSRHCVRRFLEPLAEAGLLASTEGAAPPPPTSSSEEAIATEELLRSLENLQHPVEAVVATLADPIDSGLSYKFDTTLQSLRLGVERPHHHSEGYYRDRSWLPWDDRALSTQKRELSEACRATTPGLLLFRSRGTEERYLIVLLVGETPIRGLHVDAMVRALHVAAQLGKAHPEDDERKPLAIVGPVFSGTARSMRSALHKWAEHDCDVWKVRIITGAGTGSDLRTVLTEDASEWAPGKDITFAATVAPQDALSCAYLGFLQHRIGLLTEPEERRPGIDGSMGDVQTRMPEVAFLRESGTEFGRAPSSHEPERGDERVPFKARCPKPGVELSFPVHISLLRDAYEEMDRLLPRSTDASIARRTSLGVSLREPRRPLELPEPASKSVFAQDLALSNVLETLVRRSVRHVAIQATDIGDAIFLARKIRDVTPDVRLAFFTSDVLLSHPQYRRDLDGSLIVTSYPFLGTGGFRLSEGDDFLTRDAFENAGSIGIFNAMQAIRGATAAELRDYVFGASGESLPIWISTLARGHAYPVRLLPRRGGTLRVWGYDDNGASRDGLPAEEATVVGAARSPAEVKARNEERRDNVEKRDKERRAALDTGALRLERGMTMPRSWHFVFWLVVLCALVDWTAQRRALAGWSSASLAQGSLDWCAELAIGRTKWRLYGVLRSFSFAYVLTYMAMVHVIAFAVYDLVAEAAVSSASAVGVGLALAAAAAALGVTVMRVSAFWHDYRSLSRFVPGERSRMLGWIAGLWQDFWRRSEPQLAGGPVSEHPPPPDGGEALPAVRRREPPSGR